MRHEPYRKGPPYGQDHHHGRPRMRRLAQLRRPSRHQAFNPRLGACRRHSRATPCGRLAWPSRPKSISAWLTAPASSRLASPSACRVWSGRWPRPWWMKPSDVRVLESNTRQYRRRHQPGLSRTQRLPGRAKQPNRVSPISPHIYHSRPTPAGRRFVEWSIHAC
jgi:hypothetical protein